MSREEVMNGAVRYIDHKGFREWLVEAINKNEAIKKDIPPNNMYAEGYDQGYTNALARVLSVIDENQEELPNFLIKEGF
jgi:hypothetical protein